MAKMSKKMMAFEKKDKASDKKMGLKENSKADMKMDKKMGMPAMKKGGMVKRGK
jgi:hypothetical protein